ncbi:DNA transposition protein [Aeromonas hydrophila]|uniref:AAA family ATPase n=1 Tax=Aeromonas hydrophila TaxID=644 RepID=UPI0005385845|nr:ATP-binding protein [Aeromonas hydrophila]KHA57154.1 DNA transposition protein [Aeromonas hydrophila]
MSSVQKTSRITNVELLSVAVQEAVDRAEGLPGVVVMYGYSGVGKSKAASYCVIKKRAYYVECRDTWTRKAFLQAVLADMGVVPERTLSEMVAQIAEQLAKGKRPLIVDDVQYLLDREVANVLTDIHNASNGGTLILIGEEKVPVSLKRLERLHNRVFKWVPAQQASLDDLQVLAADCYPDVVFEVALLEAVLDATKGCLRRAAVNLSHVHQKALELGEETMGLAQWGDRGWDNGEAPQRPKPADEKGE